MSGRLWLIRARLGSQVYSVRTMVPLEPQRGDRIRYGDEHSPGALELEVVRRLICVTGPPVVYADVVGPAGATVDETAAMLERLRFRKGELEVTP